MPRDMTDPRRVIARTEVFKTEDGAEILGQFFMPDHKPFAVVVLSGATGVPQGYYRDFATWLAQERGLACLTYDYRDFGRSRGGPLRQSTADMAAWGVRDAEAARKAARRLAPDTPLWLLGHSLGALLPPAQKNPEEIARVIGVATGFVHWTDHPMPYRLLPMLFWFGVGPMLTRALGYMPGRAIGFGADLPPHVFWQWRKWCTTRGFFAEDLRTSAIPPWRPHALSGPVTLFSVADDEMMPSRCTQALADAYGVADHLMLDPAAYGLKGVGHLGAFARRNRALWPGILGERSENNLSARRGSGERLTSTQAGLVTAASFRT